jgi:hypothetical protein
MSLLPEKLNNHLIAVSLIVGAFAGFQLYNGGGYVWRFIIGLFGYMFFAGLWQLWAARRK